MRENGYSYFKELHYQKDILYLYNCWDVMSAKLIESKGAKALATSSYAVSDACGYNDGEQLPFELLVCLAQKLVDNTNLPVSIDAEGLYAKSLKSLHQNAQTLFNTGIAGINFEDKKSQTRNYELWDINEQSERIQIVKSAAVSAETQIFINARTDLFFKHNNHSADLVKEALKRAEKYAEAGADGIFIPGLTKLNMIKEFTELSPLPVNIMLDSMNSVTIDWKEIGVSRVSYGPQSYFQAKRILSSNIIFKV
ncbi:hypothetical protein CHH58_03490 [Terribacillus saccharophilus]|uniref:isocitrate lyase/PEP mutase family protein n=2 Tax=Terribacillus saccharophilus TaxID=361277 RepID=UPI000BA5F7D6|nr:isocitrate lyase/phosphoenolpyruvate mutase family protein [Terribacillus saccharophilus]PAF17549.1 hypothetical protein CHH51_12940 [Terribacillus saccharophilus]PAF38507.1 hypothetical protein CHH58_03490 [Terribacillus saccharophilus]